MDQTPPVLLHQDTVFGIGRSLIYQLNWNPYKKNGTILWYNLTTNNRYIHGSELISIFHKFKAKHTQNGSSVKHAKEGHWIIQAILRFL